MNNLSKKKKIICLSLGILSIGAGIGFGFGFNQITETKHINYSQRMQNSLFIDQFIGNIGSKDFITRNDFEKSIKLIDESGEEIKNYSNLTIKEAYEKNYFKFELSKKVAFYAEKYDLNIYLKKYFDDQDVSAYPIYYNSSIPEFKIWFSKGEGENKAENYFTISNSGLNNFAKSQEEADVSNIINLFKNNFSLKNEFYNNGDKNQGIKKNVYAKNIKSTDIISNIAPNDIRGVVWKITSVSQNPKDASELNITVDFYKGDIGNTYFSNNYQKFNINNFSIETGVDDNVSKVKNFIAKKGNLDGFNESFLFTKPKDAPSDYKMPTVREAYEQNLFSLTVPPSLESRATSAGVEYIFKLYDENNDSMSAFPDKDNSKIPEFKIFVRAGGGTSTEYEEFFVVTGYGQVTSDSFKITDESQSIEEIKNIDFSDKVNILLKNEFDGIIYDKQTGFNITSKIIANVENPLENIELTLKSGNGFDGLKIEILDLVANKDNLIIKTFIYYGEEFKNKAVLDYNFKFKCIDESIYNKNIVFDFINIIEAEAMDPKAIISTKKDITTENKNDVLETIKNRQNFYFNDFVYVGYDDIMKNYKWSQKPTFVIDINNTKLDDTNNKIIIFSIKVQSGNYTTNTTIAKNVSSFIK